jgi:hypothetical protein
VPAPSDGRPVVPFLQSARENFAGDRQEMPQWLKRTRQGIPQREERKDREEGPTSGSKTDAP